MMKDNSERETLVIKQPKKKIEKIKKKYKNLSMSDETAEKIIKLQTLNNFLKLATVGAGVATVIDFFVADPVPFIDEALMTGVTMALKSGNNIIENKIKDLATSEETELNMSDCEEIRDRLVDIKKGMSKKRLK